MKCQHFFAIVVLSCLAFVANSARAGASFGIETRVPNTVLLIPEVPEGEVIPEGFPIQLSDIPALLATGLAPKSDFNEH